MIKLLIPFIFFFTLTSFSQAKEIRKTNRDSLEWEKQGNVFSDDEYLNKLQVSKHDGRVTLHSNIRFNHRIFGYEKSDLKSKRLLLFSVFTFDVKDNPCNCAFGSFYDTSSMDGITLHYVGNEKDFIKVDLLRNSNKQATVYFEKKWVEFE